MKPALEAHTYGTITINGITTAILPEKGYKLIPQGKVIKKGDKVYDYHAGWMLDHYGSEAGNLACVEGKWLAWERKAKR